MTSPSGNSETPLKKSKVEEIKEASSGLYGTIPDEIGAEHVCFSETSIQVLKHHGTYQQDNRDLRSERRKAGLDKDYRMMVRTKTPGGLMTAEGYLACDDLASKYGQDDLRITSRQGFQFHGVLKGNLRALIKDLNTFAQMHTKGACGDVVRNVTCSNVVDIDPAYAKLGADLFALSTKISDHFLPQSRSYYDLWLDDEKVSIDADGNVSYKAKHAAKPEDEPIYKQAYLPRKFKIGVATDFDNSIDVYTNDLGVIACTKDGKITGYEILIGGGLGHSHSKQDTYARLGSAIANVAESEIIPVIEAVVGVQRDFGNREQRHQARMKYTIDGMGLEAFREKVQEYYGKPLPAATGIAPSAQPDYLGWHKEITPGLNYVGIWVENGRIRDFADGIKFRTGLRKIIETYKPSVRLTAHHNIVLSGIGDADVDAVKAIMAEYGLPTQDSISPLRRMEMACPALPLCGLALAEAEREMPRLLKQVEDLGHGDADVIIRMTGCPNNCARPASAEIGIIGRGPNKYNVYVGGNRTGTRLNTLVKDTITVEDLPATLGKLLGDWKAEREDGEAFGDWAHRVGYEELTARLA
ncbi:MAG: NADPH-dependent assimilatory sulfite reductase hemoprotein subunit [Sumerlaeia bacterium]